MLDPDFQIVEAARADATGYSFPSGHTQNIVGTTASIFASRKETWVRIVCIVLMVLVPFSRMYLGVHTPLDVGVAFLTAAWRWLRRSIRRSGQNLPQKRQCRGFYLAWRCCAADI